MKDKDKTNDEVKEQKENEPQEAKEPASVEPETSVSSDAEAEEKAILEDVEELQKKLEESTAKSEEYLDRLRRTMAEFDNFRKRTQKEKEQIFDRGAKDVLEQILPVIDNFERALAGNDKKDDSFAKGVEMIYKQDVYKRQGYRVDPDNTKKRLCSISGIQKGFGVYMAGIKEQLKAGTLGRLYLLYGEEAYLKTYYSERILHLLLTPEDEMMNCDVLEGVLRGDKEGGFDPFFS